MIAKQFRHLNAAAIMRKDAMDPEYAHQRHSLLKAARWHVWESARLRKLMGER